MGHPYYAPKRKEKVNCFFGFHSKESQEIIYQLWVDAEKEIIELECLYDEGKLKFDYSRKANSIRDRLYGIAFGYVLPKDCFCRKTKRVKNRVVEKVKVLINKLENWK